MKLSRNLFVLFIFGYLVLPLQIAWARIGEDSSTNLDDHEKHHRKLILATAGGISDQYIVRFSDNVQDVNGKVAVLLQRLGSVGDGVMSHLFTYTSAIKGFAVHGVIGERLQRLLEDSDVATVEQDQMVYSTADESNPTWGIDRIDERSLPLDHNYHYDYTGQGVNIYVIDSGVRTTHDEFGGRASCGFNAITSESCGDGVGHGTHVSGTAAGTTYGVAKQANIIAVKVLDSSGGGAFSGVVAGVDFVQQEKQSNPSRPMVANMSLGGPPSNSLDSAVANAVSTGVVFVVAAGNNSGSACFSSPASSSVAITVGATTDRDSRASFSNFGRCVDVFAPGQDITSSWSTSDSATNTISGTSMACPHVTGTAALYLEANPSWSPSQVMNALIADSTANVITSAGGGSPDLLVYTGSIGSGSQGGNGGTGGNGGGGGNGGSGGNGDTGGGNGGGGNPEPVPVPQCGGVFSGCSSNSDCCSDSCIFGLCWFF